MKNSTLTEEQANEQIARKILEAETAIKEAEKIADKYGLHFRWNGFEYGMGGTYFSRTYAKNNRWHGSSQGWVASSGSC